MTQSIDHIVLPTKDIQKCLAFYGEILECEIKDIKLSQRPRWQFG